MKKCFVYMGLCFLVPLSIVSGELYYYGGGERIKLNLCRDKIFVKWGEGIRSIDKERTLVGLPILRKIDLQNLRYRTTIMEIDTSTGLYAPQVAENLLVYPEIEFAYPLFYTDEGDTLIFTNEIIVKLKPPLTASLPP